MAYHTTYRKAIHAIILFSHSFFFFFLLKMGKLVELKSIWPIIQPSKAIHGIERDCAIYHEKRNIEMPQIYTGSNLIFCF